MIAERAKGAEQELTPTEKNMTDEGYRVSWGGLGQTREDNSAETALEAARAVRSLLVSESMAPPVVMMSQIAACCAGTPSVTAQANTALMVARCRQLANC